ncbi:MAG: class I adenylate-forming enzyme family protein [Mycobacteriales bacterium]
MTALQDERPTSTTLHALLQEKAARAPQQEALRTTSSSRTYAQWLEGCERVAGGLAAAGARAGGVVALLADNRSEWLETAFGAAALGATLAPMNTWVRAWDLDYLLGHARPDVLVMVDRLGKQDFLAALRELVPELWEAAPGTWRSSRYPFLRAVVVVGDQVPPGALPYAELLAHEPLTTRSPAGPDDVAMVLYTSGSTARPKAVPLVHRDLIENGFEIGERQGLTPRDRVFLASPLFWAYGGANALMATLTHGAALILQSTFEATEALALLQEQRCTALYTLPAVTHALLDEPSFAADRLPALRRGLTLGPPSEITLVADALGADLICNIYGSTEVYGNCCVTPYDAPLEQRRTSQGPPLPGVEVRVVDPDSGAVLPPDELGEILVRGRLSPGYLDAEGRAEPLTDADGFFHTGDLGVLSAAGWLSFASRSTEMIKSSGINVSPSEVEDFLMSHPDVVEAAVVGAEDPVRGQQVVAFVRLWPNSDTTAASIQTWCRETIAGYKAPRVVLAVDELPTTSTGKLARRDLVALANRALQPGPEQEAVR